MITRHNKVLPPGGPSEKTRAPQAGVHELADSSTNESCATVCGDCRVCGDIKRRNISALLWLAVLVAIMAANLYYIAGGH